MISGLHSVFDATFRWRAPQSARLSVNGKVAFTLLELNAPKGFGALIVMGGPQMRTYEVRAHRDAGAGVWWAESDDVPGLVAEAQTHDALIAELKLLVPELLALNAPNAAGQSAVLKVISEQVEDLCYA